MWVSMNWKMHINTTRRTVIVNKKKWNKILRLKRLIYLFPSKNENKIKNCVICASINIPPWISFLYHNSALPNTIFFRFIWLSCRLQIGPKMCPNSGHFTVRTYNRYNGPIMTNILEFRQPPTEIHSNPNPLTCQNGPNCVSSNLKIKVKKLFIIYKHTTYRWLVERKLNFKHA